MSNTKIQQIFRHYYLTNDTCKCGYHPHRVLRNIVYCRSSVLGGMKIICKDCNHEQYIYRSCGDRHCPTCNSLKQLCWKESRVSEYIDVPYYHAVFTVPDTLNEYFMKNKEVCYNLLFQSVSDTLLTLGKDPKRLGAKLGFICVLHTWGSTLSYHPHIHVILPGCGLNRQQQLVRPKGEFFFPVKAMSKLFKGKFLDGLKTLLKLDTIELAKFYVPDWVVYLKPCMNGSEHVVEYLSRYTHKIAISNSRIIRWDENTVTFNYKDYRDQANVKQMTLSLNEFVRRYLMHVLPERFVKVRFYGFLSNRAKINALPLIRRLLKQEPPVDRLKGKSAREILEILYGEENSICTCRGCGSINVVKISFGPMRC